ncbi:MAG: Rieske (2Fe-2S) protein [Acidobacteriota bacterium]|nr:Rieske (2Fe-2S) protein [Blastocatellia bacterium]MDW8411507.1 Rieske (2Fe-2S) protein [Acidobacteriota bacterium]
MDLSRRRLLAGLGWLTAIACTAASGLLAGLYAIVPSLRQKKSLDSKNEWTQLAELSSIPNNQPVKFSLQLSVIDGWAESTTRQAVWVIRRQNTIDIFSAVCPHEGCSVDYEASAFVCRCHASYWKDDGTRTSGPSPRNLDRLDYRIVGDRLEVRYQNFKLNTAEKIPV